MKLSSIFGNRTIPLSLALILIFNATLATAAIEYLILKKSFDQKITMLVTANQNPEELVKEVTRLVTPADGYETSLFWEDLGQKLVDSGAIDIQKYEEIFNSNTNGMQEMGIFNGENRKITINENNSRFLVNTLWALGLVNKSKVLDEGQMMTGDTEPGNFASTGGWTLGSKDAMQIYSSQELIPLSDEQQDLVKKIAENVYRPCCGNNTAFPDCNHGMAALGYIELAVSKDISEKQIYQDLLAFNSFWFPQTYVEMAVYFQRQEGKTWDQVDPKKALSQDYSSSQGAQKIKAAVQDVPGLKSQGGSCGA